MNKYILDTNFVLRFLLKDNAKQYKEAKEYFDKAIDGEITLILEQAAFTEIVFVLNSFYKIDKAIFVPELREILAYKGIETNIEALSLTLDLYLEHNMHIVDCLLLALSNLDSQSIPTFDKKLNKLSNS